VKLWFCKIKQLKDILKNQLKMDAKYINISPKKPFLVQRILHYLRTLGGEVIGEIKIPENCKMMMVETKYVKTKQETK